MQYSITTAITTVLCASVLTSAAAVPQASTAALTEIDLIMKNGDGDASVGRTVLPGDFGFLLSSDSNGLSFKGVTLRMSSEGAKCGVFDPKSGALLKNGKKDLVFDSTSSEQVFGKGSSPGEVNSKLSDAVSVAVCCDAEAKFAQSCAKPQPKPWTSIVSVNLNPTATQTSPPPVFGTLMSDPIASIIASASSEQPTGPGPVQVNGNGYGSSYGNPSSTTPTGGWDTTIATSTGGWDTTVATSTGGWDTAYTPIITVATPTGGWDTTYTPATSDYTPTTSDYAATVTVTVSVTPTAGWN